MSDDAMAARFLRHWLAWLTALPALVWSVGAFAAWDARWPEAVLARLGPLAAWEAHERVVLLLVAVAWPIVAGVLATAAILPPPPWCRPPPRPPVADRRDRVRRARRSWDAP